MKNESHTYTHTQKKPLENGKKAEKRKTTKNQEMQKMTEKQKIAYLQKYLMSEYLKDFQSRIISILKQLENTLKPFGQNLFNDIFLTHTFIGYIGEKDRLKL